MIMKTFKLSFTEYNGEQSYDYSYLIYARTENAATNKAKKFLRHWYDDPDVDFDWENDRIEFNCGCNVIGDINLLPYGESEFKNELLERYIIR
jgi:hypothetical protein